MIVRPLGWLIHRLGPQMLLWLVLLLVALSSVALGLADAVRGLDAGLLLPVTVWGLLVGWGLAKLPLPGWLGGLVALGLGMEMIVLRVGRLGKPLVALLSALVRNSIDFVAFLIWRPKFLDWLPDGTLTLLALEDLRAGVSALLARSWSWALALAAGEPTFDLVAVALVWSLALWAVACWAGWWVWRRDQPLPGLVPAGALLSASLFYVQGNPAFLLPTLWVGLLLTALVGHNSRQRRWEASGIDFPLDLGLEVAMGGGALSLVLVTAAMLTPAISVQQMTEWAGGFIGGQRGEAKPVAGSLGLNPQASLSKTIFDQDKVRAPGLPRRHLLGSGPELSEQVRMIIYPQPLGSTEGNPAPDLTQDAAPSYYWRGLTYDRYIGRGWITSQTQVAEYRAGEFAISGDGFETLGVDSETISMVWPGRSMVRMEVRSIGDLGELLYTAGDLVTADQNYRVAWRSLHDAFGAIIISSGRNRGMRGAGSGMPDGESNGDRSIIYRVDSMVPAVGEAQLKAAGSNYPSSIQSRYLALPDTVPPRVIALARDLTATALTPYERARAIETYLRTFPYTLDLPHPPPDRDVVDYFLFDLQQGYCDYYATSMVVLARAAGLPARLAVGYLNGTYDRTEGRYVVTEADAHSWVEIYFPDYGWIEFEPTAGRAPIDRPADVSPTVPPELEKLEPMAMEYAGVTRLWRLGLAGAIALLGLGGITWSLIDSWRLRRLSPKDLAVVLYWRLHRHGRRLAVPIRPGDTPYEFAASLAECLAAISRTDHWSTMLTAAAQESRWLAALYVRTCYGSYSLSATDLGQAIHTWRRLRRRLWLVWILQTASFIPQLTSAFSRSARHAGHFPIG
jgi:hypothetical protein